MPKFLMTLVLSFFLVKPVLAFDSSQSCDSCHVDLGTTFTNGYESFQVFKKKPFQVNKGCVYCHVNNHFVSQEPHPPSWLPIDPGHINDRHSYLNVPALVLELQSKKGKPIQRFTRCGLDAYLRNPIKRHGATTAHMFPVPDDVRRRLLSRWDKKLAPCDDSVGLEGDLQAGETLYKSSGCAGCHESSAPRIRLGLPLFARAYFAHRVRNGSEHDPLYRHRWQRSDQKGFVLQSDAEGMRMPAYAQLSEQELRNLYSYLSRPLKPAAGEPGAVLPFAHQPARLVFGELFDKTCKHCHNASEKNRQEIKHVFHASKPPPVLPTSKYPLTDDVHREEFSRLASPGPQCENSVLLDALILRLKEVQGASHVGAGRGRGMPLTQDPVSQQLLDAVRDWSGAGCPAPDGKIFYCKPCRSPRL